MIINDAEFVDGNGGSRVGTSTQSNLTYYTDPLNI